YEHLEANDIYYEDGQYEVSDQTLSMVNGRMQISMTVSSNWRQNLPDYVTHFKVRYWFYGYAVDTDYDHGAFPDSPDNPYSFSDEIAVESAYIPLN
ncbi:MAG: hypothetical protein J6P31_07450, partial [Oscillospiraceae bacterium]|nr:hypothetical protein [Oscillospiraceae bacterium]